MSTGQEHLQTRSGRESGRLKFAGPPDGRSAAWQPIGSCTVTARGGDKGEEENN